MCGLCQNPRGYRVRHDCHSDIRLEQVMKKWKELAKRPDSPSFRRYRKSFLRRMWNASEWKDSEDVELARANTSPDRRGKFYAAGIETPGYIPQVVEKGDNVRAVRLMQLLQWEPKSPAYLRTTLGVASREYFTKAYLRPLADAGLIARSDPEHPNSPQQKYVLTKDGRRRVEKVTPL